MLETLKSEVCEIAKRAQKERLCKHKAGNFSAKDKESGFVVITPAAVDRALLKPDDMVVVDMEANVIENLSKLKPSSETLMHIEIYKERSDIYAISHTHSIYATMFAILNKPIPAIVYEVASLGLKKARIPVAPYGRPGTPELAKSIIDACREADSFLLEKHGVVAIATDIYEAFLKSSYIEELAELYYLSLSVNGGKEPDTLKVEELERWKYPKEIKLR